MANKPVIFKFEHVQTGKIYQVEGDPGSTQEEAMSYLDSLAPEDLGQYEYKAPTTAPQAAPQNAAAPVASPTDAPKRVELGVSVVQGNVDPDYDPRWMGAEQEALVTQMMADPQYSYEDIDKYVREQARSKGLPEMGLAGPPEQLAAYRESLAAGQSPSSVGYTDWKNELNAPTPEADPEEGWLAAFNRAYDSATQYGTAGIMARTYHDWMDTGKEKLRERFPGASEDQLEAMQSDLVNWTQKKLREADAIESEDDPLIPWLAGELIGGAGVEDFVPGGPMAGIAKRTGIAAGTNVAADAAYQGIDIASGVQDEFSGEQLALSGALGAGLHLGVEGVGATARKVRGEGRAPEPEVEEPSSREDLEDYLAIQAEPRVPGKIRERNQKLKESRQFALDQANEHVGELMSGWQNAPSYEVVPTFKTLDGVDNDAVGAYGPDGKLLINLENIRNPADLTAVTYHEALGHHGLSQRFADELDNVLTDFYDNGISTFREKVDEWLENNPNEYVNEPNRIARAAEEVLAEWSEEGALPRTLKDRISNFLKELARSMGLDLKFSEREIKSILAMAHSAVTNGKGRDVRVNGFRYATVWHGSPHDFDAFDHSRMGTGEGAQAYGWGTYLTDTKGIAEHYRQKLSNMEYEVAPDGTYMTTSGKSFREIIHDLAGTIKVKNPEIKPLKPGAPIGRKAARAAGKPLFIEEPLLEPEEMAWLEKVSRDLHPAGDYWRFRDARDEAADRVFASRDAMSQLLEEKYNNLVSSAEGSLDYEAARQQLLHDKAILSILDELSRQKLVGKGGRLYEVELPDDAQWLLWDKPYSEQPKKVQEALEEYSAIPQLTGKEIYVLLTEHFDSAQKASEYLASRGIHGNKYLTGLDRAKGDGEYNYVVFDNKTPKIKNKYSKKLPPTSAGFKRPVIDDRFKREDRLKRGRLKRSQHKSYEQWQSENGLVDNTVETVTLEDGSTVDVLIDRRGQIVDTMDHRSPRGNLLPDDTKPSVQEINQLRNPETPLGVEEELVNLNTGEPGPVVRLYNDDEARKVMERRTGGRRYSKKRPARTEEAEIESAIFLNQQVLDNYEPTYRSWAEGKRAARERGLTPKQIRSAKSIGELDKRMFQYDAAAEKLNNRLSELHSRMDDGTFTMRDKANYLETMFAFNEVTARIFQDQAEVARALNALKAVQYTKNKISQLNQILAEYQGNNLNAFADDATFFKFAKEVQEMIEQGNPRGAENMVKHVIKPYWWQYILSFRHSMMLSGLATHAKNISDNGLMIARELEESILATAGFPIRQGLKAMGLNVKEGVSPQEAAGRLYGILRAALDATTYQRTAKAFREGHGNTPYSKKIELADVRIPGVSKVQDALHAEDVFFRSFHDNANLYSLGIRQARAEGFKGLAAFEEGSNIAMNPTDNIRKMAKELTDMALLVDQPSGPASRLEALKSIKPGMKSGEQATAFAANIIFPFFRVTDRLLFQQLRRSPLSFVDRVTREDWAAGGARRDIAVARTLMGSALIYYYWWKAGTGEDVLGLLGDNTEKEIEGNAPSWEKQQALEAGGYLPNSVVEDDRYVDATALNLSLFPDDLQNAVAANVATIRKAYENGKADVEGTANAIGMATKSLLSILSSSSFAENVSTYVDPFRDNQNEGQENAAYGNVIGGLGSQFVPAAVRQYNQQFGDPIKRDTTGDKSVFGGIPGLGGEDQGRVLGRLKSGIPSLSDDLPPRYSLYGEEMEQGRTLLGMDNYQKIKKDPVSQELQRLERTTDDPVVTGAPSSFRMNDLIGVRFDGTSPYVVKRSDGMVANEKGYVKLTAEGKQEWQRVLGYFIKESMRSTILSDEWRQASDEEKIAIVKETKRDANQATKEYMLPLLGLEGFGAEQEEE